MRLFTKSKKIAIFMTYTSIVVQMLSTMILTSFYLKKLGTDAYGLYQMVYAVAQYILILDLGIGTTIIRYVTEFDAKNNHEEAENFTFHFALILGAILIVIAFVGLFIYSKISSIYPTLSVGEVGLARQMFLTMIIQIMLTVISHFYQGIALAYEQYAFVKAVSVVQIVTSTFLSILFILCGMNVMGIVRANTIAILINILIITFYIKYGVKFKIKFHYWNFGSLKPAFVLMLAMLLQSVVGYMNNSVDKTILGIMTTKADVAIYSIAATFLTMFNALPTAISSVFQPKVTRMVICGATSEELTDFVVKPGRFQLILVGGFCAGFFLFGKDFIICWTNKEMTDAWLYFLLIMIPNAIPLIQNTCLAILNAMDKRIFRSLILVGITVCNIFLTIFMIKWLGAVGAPIATGISYIIGHCVIMNIYYHKKIKLDVFRMFGGIFKGIWKCILIAFVIGIPMMFWKIDGNWVVFGIKAIVFCVIYATLLYIIGLNKEEKNMILSILKKVRLSLKIKSN